MLAALWFMLTTHTLAVILSEVEKSPMKIRLIFIYTNFNGNGPAGVDLCSALSGLIDCKCVNRSMTVLWPCITVGTQKMMHKKMTVTSSFGLS